MVDVIAFWDFRRFDKENPDVTWKLLQHLAEVVAGEQRRPSALPAAR